MIKQVRSRISIPGTVVIKPSKGNEMKYEQPAYTPESITQLEPNEVFVFGSNIEGRHGKGAAKLAMRFGAVYGQPDGLQGQTYAIVTKDLRSRSTYPLQQIQAQIGMLFVDAEQYPDKVFLVTKIGCGLGGYSVQEIAELFIGLEIPSNVVLPREFIEVIKMKQVNTIPENKIPAFRNEFSFLSNMYQCKVAQYSNAEAAFMAQKCLERKAEFVGITGGKAKKLGKQVQLRSDWDEVKLGLMEKVLRVKFKNPMLMDMLKAVEGEIVERNYWKDTYWGVCNNIGTNHLGKLLMKIRDEEIEMKMLSDKQTVNMFAGNSPVVLVAGGRDFNDYERVKADLAKHNPVVIISGMAKGADALGVKYANEYGCQLKEFKANWSDMSEPCIAKRNRYGEYNALAGMKRNQQMLDEGKPDLVLVYWDGKSSGTKDMIAKAEKAGVKVQVELYGQGEIDSLNVPNLDVPSAFEEANM